jgi:tRNA pseudouridine55 synthase
VKKIIILNKKEGETPLEALESFRSKNKEYGKTKMTYAGRLDPMASGVLPILVSDETKNKEKYLALDKEYNFKVLFGFSTDTYDILGKVVSSSGVSLDKNILKKEIKNILKNFSGELHQKYPIYSSKTVKGKPLFLYARDGEDVIVPQRKIFIKKFILEKITESNNKKILENIRKRIKKVKGDFRQEEILKIWEKKLNHKEAVEKFFIASFRIKCSSGTYVRGVANSIGEKIKIPALAFSIKRTRVGGYVL